MLIVQQENVKDLVVMRGTMAIDTRAIGQTTSKLVLVPKFGVMVRASSANGGVDCHGEEPRQMGMDQVYKERLSVARQKAGAIPFV
jgi:hypothetical protein